MTATAYTDGGSRSENRRAGIGVSLCTEDDREVFALAQFIGPGTCNEAEYHALLRCLEISAALSIDHLAVYSDSQLMVNQMCGRSQCRHPALYRLFCEARQWTQTFLSFSIRHIRRGCNQRADYLASYALTQGWPGSCWVQVAGQPEVVLLDHFSRE